MRVRNSLSLKSGLVFPCARIRRYLKSENKLLRINKTAPVYITAVLEYIAAEILEASGNICKEAKKMKITPIHIREMFRSDKEFGEFAKGGIF